MEKNLSIKKKPSQARSQQRLKLINQAAEQILNRDGLTGLTMPKLALEAEVSVGSLYQYYPNKKAVLKSIYDRYLMEIRQTVTQFSTQLDIYPDWKSGLKALFTELFTAEQNNGPMRELNQAMQLYPELEEADRRHSDEIALQIYQILKHYQIPGSESELMLVIHFCYAINIGTWDYRSRFNSSQQIQQCNRWEIIADMAVFEDYIRNYGCG